MIGCTSGVWVLGCFGYALQQLCCNSYELVDTWNTKCLLADLRLRCARISGDSNSLVVPQLYLVRLHGSCGAGN
jgi:hypothetical protein